jgi:hypothetical protein
MFGTLPCVVPGRCRAYLEREYSTGVTIQAKQNVGYALVVGETSRASEKIISDWSLAPPGVRRRAEQLRARTTAAHAVWIVRLASHAFISGGAWVVALLPANGDRRRFLYAESDKGEPLGEWNDEESL